MLDLTKLYLNIPENLRVRIKPILDFLGISYLYTVHQRLQTSLRYYQPKLIYIFKWIWLDTEDANFYYDLTEVNKDQLAQVISLISGVSYTLVQGYFRELEQDSNLQKHILTQLSRGDYGKEIKVMYGRRLWWYALVRCLRPKIVVETGVDHGVGSCVITSALLRNIKDGSPGYYYGTEIRSEAGKLLSGKYAKVGEILYGDSLASLNKLNKKVDMFINDSDHSAEYEYKEYQLIKNKLANKAILLGDNSHVTDKLSQFSRENKRNYIFFSEQPKDHWYPGAGIGISFTN